MADNLKELHEKQDKFIKDTFAEDKIINTPIFENFSTYIDATPIKVKKYTHKQVRIIKLLALLLTISIIVNFYLYYTKHNNIQDNNKKDDKPNMEFVVIDEAKKDNLNNNEDKNEEKPEEEKNEVNNVVNNTTDDSSIVVKPGNEVENEVAQNKVEEKPNSNLKPIDRPTPNRDNEVILEEINDLLESYAIGLNRTTTDVNNLESNTMYLFMAKNYFNNKTNKSDSTNQDKYIYASTKENFHKYLEELTGLEYTKMKSIPSFNNYIGYVKASNSYAFGPNAKEILKEKYSVSNTKITHEAFGQYTATTHITRHVDGVDTNYDVEFTFKLNDNYTYTKYNILSLKAKNTSFYPDNTLRLIDHKDASVEKDKK